MKNTIFYALVFGAVCTSDVGASEAGLDSVRLEKIQKETVGEKDLPAIMITDYFYANNEDHKFTTDKIISNLSDENGAKNDEANQNPYPGLNSYSRQAKNMASFLYQTTNISFDLARKAYEKAGDAGISGVAKGARTVTENALQLFAEQSGTQNRDLDVVQSRASDHLTSAPQELGLFQRKVIEDEGLETGVSVMDLQDTEVDKTILTDLNGLSPEDRCRFLEEQHNKKNQEIEALNTLMNQQKTDAQAQLNDKDQAIRDLEQEKKQQTIEKEKQRKALHAQIQADQKALEEHMAIAEKKNADNSNERHQLQKLVGLLNEQVDRLTHEKQKLQNDTARLTERVQCAEINEQHQEIQLNEKERELKEQLREMESLKIDYTTLQSELTMAHDELLTKEQDIATYDEQRKHNQDEKQELQNEMDALIKKCAQVEEINNKFALANEELANDQGSTLQAYDALRKQYNDIVEQLERQ